MAIASRHTGKYLESLWETREGIIDHLCGNGYTLITASSHSDLVLGSEKLGGVKVFSMGEYRDWMVSHWIKFYDPDKLPHYVMFCRDKDTVDKIVDNVDLTNYAKINLDTGFWIKFDDFEDFRRFTRNNLGI